VLTITHFEECLGADRTFIHVGGCMANKRLLESIDKAALLAWCTSSAGDGPLCPHVTPRRLKFGGILADFEAR